MTITKQKAVEQYFVFPAPRKEVEVHWRITYLEDGVPSDTKLKSQLYTEADKAALMGDLPNTVANKLSDIAGWA